MTQKYLNRFADHSGYAAFVRSAEFVTPSVSYCVEEGEVHFNPIPRHEYVDLGLPSGTLWATENIKDTDGNELYFAWGETVGYAVEQIGVDKNFSWEPDGKYPNDYAFGPVDWNDSSDYGMTKYNSIDGKTVLDATDDAATVYWGSKWRMPTKEQFEELIANTEYEWTEIDGIQGAKFTSKVEGHTDKFLFFPAVGYAEDGEVYDVGDYGGCWSVSLYDKEVADAWNFGFDDGGYGADRNGRYCGYPVRPVKIQNHKYVDLDLPSGTLWAECNIGARTPNDVGLYFAWGETHGYTANQIGSDKYFYDDGSDNELYDSANGVFTKYYSSLYDGDGKVVLESEDDAASVNWGPDWCIPTMTQIEELFDYTTRTYDLNNNGIIFESTENGNTLFIPFGNIISSGAAITNYGETVMAMRSSYRGKCANFDTAQSVICNSSSDEMWMNDMNSTSGINRCYGIPIRPVKTGFVDDPENLPDDTHECFK